MQLSRRVVVLAGLAGGVVSVAGGAARGQSWDGGGSNNLWSSGGFGGNWSGFAAPVSDNNGVLFFSASPRLNPVNDLTGPGGTPFRVFDLTFNASAGAYVLSGNAIRFSGGRLFQQSASVITVNNDLSATLSFLTTPAPLQVAGFGSGRVVLNGVIGPVAGIFKIGNFPLELTNGLNTITATITIGDTTTNATGGALIVPSAAAMGTAGLALNGGSVLRPSASFVFPRAVSVGGTAGGGYDVADGLSLTLSGTLTGSSPVAKTGLGTLEISGTNNHSGVVNVNAGTLVVAGPARLGTGASAVNLANGVTLRGTAGGTGTRTLAFNGTVTVDVASGVVWNQTGPMTGTNITLAKTGGGDLVASPAAANAMTATAIRVTGGRIGATRAGALGTGPVQLAGGGLRLDGAGAQSLGNPVAVEQDATLSAAAGSVWTLSGAVSGAGELDKIDGGRVLLAGTANLPGGISIIGGELGIQSAVTADVRVNGGATLLGTGTLTGTISDGSGTGVGTVSPGVLTPGILTATALDAQDMRLQVEVNAAQPTFASATASGNDLLRLTGASPIVGAATTDTVINFYLGSTVSLPGGAAVFEAGVFTDSGADFAALLAAASVNVYRQQAGGSLTFQGQTYVPVTGRRVQVGTAAETADFGGGPVAGRILTLSIGPAACSLADIASVGGAASPDGLLTGDDFVAFINAFAEGSLAADVTGIGGPPEIPDGLLTGDDFNAFITAFAAGCN